MSQVYVKFTPKDPVTGAQWTFGDLCRNPEVQKAWAEYAHPDNASPVEEGVVGWSVLPFVQTTSHCQSQL